MSQLLKHPPLEIKVWGGIACFTRPEMKVERVSYDIMTPSAARGVFEAIFWKPEFNWQVKEIWVLNPIRHFSILRNEVNSKAVISTARKWAKEGRGYFAEDDRAQRNTLALREVSYLLKADVVLKPHASDNIAKYRDQFRRRVERGQCHHIPYLGCREFSAYFAHPDGSERALDLTDDLGQMLFDVYYDSDESGRGMPRFFHARLEAGILQIPADLYQKGE